MTDPLPVEASMRRPLTEAEVKAFLDSIDVTTAQGLKDRLAPLSEVARDGRLFYLAARAEVDHSYRERVKSLTKNPDNDTLSNRVTVQRTGGEREA